MNNNDSETNYKPTIVIASGFFNPIHYGHLVYLAEAKRLGTFLSVIVNNDEQVIRKKGGIIVPEVDRWWTVHNLKWVDQVIIATDQDDTVCDSIKTIYHCHGGHKFDIFNFVFANGGDVKSCREQKVCDELGIKTVFGVGGYNKSISSSDIIRNAYLSYAKSINCGDG